MFPERLKNNYYEILKLPLVANRDLSNANIAQFEQLLNDSQPANPDEIMMRQVIYQLYRLNPESFRQYILNPRNRCQYLILWVEAKQIAHAFGLLNRVYIGWDSVKYKCCIHNKRL